jgi:cytochrome c-type biogenesis protein CcmH/NrfG
MRRACIAVTLSLLANIGGYAEPATDLAAAISLYRQKQNVEARTAFESLLAIDNKNAEAIHFLGLIALREKRDDDAVRLHENATALAPENSAYFIALGDAYGRKAAKASLFSKLEWAQKCRAALEKAVALEPASVAAQSALIEYYRRAPGMAGGGMTKAYAQAHSYKKADLVGGTLLLVDLYRRESKHAEIFTALEEALRAHPDDYRLLINMGRAAADSGEKLERGEESLQRCLSLLPPARAPDHATVWFYIGQIHLKQTNPASARTAFESALTLDPAHRESTEALGKLQATPRAPQP